jgi:hypothetical protein
MPRLRGGHHVHEHRNAGCARVASRVVLRLIGHTVRPPHCGVPQAVPVQHVNSLWPVLFMTIVVGLPALAVTYIVRKVRRHWRA